MYGSGSGLEKIMDPEPDPVCPEMSDLYQDLVWPERLDSVPDPDQNPGVNDNLPLIQCLEVRPRGKTAEAESCQAQFA